MQRKKCCYCEAYIPEEGHLKAVEHFRPQSVYSNLMNDWPNLLLACAQCNGKKSDKFPRQLPDGTNVIRDKSGRRTRTLLINPSDDEEVDPEDHLDFVVSYKELAILGLIRPKNGSRRGDATIQTTGLFKSFHTARHKKLIQRLQILLVEMDRANDQNDQMHLQELKRRFRSELSAGSEFAAVARTFAREHQLDQLFGIDIPVGWNTA